MGLQMLNRIVFLDRDDTLILTNLQCAYYITDPDDVILCTGVGEGMKRLRDANVLSFVVTKQDCVPKGIISKFQLGKIHRRVLELVEEAGGHIVHTSVIWSEDAAAGKARQILHERFHLVNNTNASTSFWMVGNSASDIEAGKRAGCKTILVWYDNSEFQVAPEELEAAMRLRGQKPETDADYEVLTFKESVDIILGEEV